MRPHCRGPVPSPAWPVGKCLPLPQLLRPRFWGAAAIRPCVTEPLRVGVIGWAVPRNPGTQSALGASGSPSPRGPAEQARREAGGHKGIQAPDPSLLRARQGAEPGTHPIGIRQSLAFSFSTRREVIFPGFPLSARDMDSTLRRTTCLAGSPQTAQCRQVLGNSQGAPGWPDRAGGAGLLSPTSTLTPGPLQSPHTRAGPHSPKTTAPSASPRKAA